MNEPKMRAPWDREAKKDGLTEYEDLYKTLTEETLDLAGAVKAINERWGNNRTVRAAELTIQRETGMGFGQHILKARATIQEKMIEGDDKATKVLDLKRREEKATNQEREIDKKITELLEAQDFERRFLETVGEIVSGFNLKPLAHTPKPKKSDTRTVESAVLLLSDLHAGEVVDKDEMGGVGEFNWSILESRLSFVFETTRKYLLENMSNHHFDTLHIQMLGDMVSGQIHEELLKTEQFTVFEYVVGLANLLAQAILYLAPHFPNIKVTGVVGNHGRLTKKPAFKQAAIRNFDYLTYIMCRNFVLERTDNVEFVLPKSFFAETDIEGWNCLAYHGDGIRSYLGLPFYGLTRAVNEWQDIMVAQGKMFSYMFLGHFHRPATLSNINVETFLNGSLIGANEFSLKAVRGGHRPRQWLLGFHRKHGCSWRLAISLDAATEDDKLFSYDPTLLLPQMIQP